MNVFSGPVFSLPDGLGGVTWHQWHGTFNASVRITAAEGERRRGPLDDSEISAVKERRSV